MLSLLLLATIGQPGATSPRTLETWNVACPMGHAINVRGYRDGNTFRAEFPVAANAGPRRPDPATNGVVQSYFPKHKRGEAWYGGNVDAKPAVGASKGEKPNRVHLTIVGTQVEREAVRRELEANPDFVRMQAEMGDNFAFQLYGAENPLVADIGLVDGGHPDVVVQTTLGGRVAYRAHSNPGADTIVGEIRRADPRYDASKDPGEGFKLDIPALLKKYNVGSDELVAAGLCALLGFAAVAKGKV